MKGFLEVLFFIYYCVAKKYGIYIEDTFFGNSLLPPPLNSLAKTEISGALSKNNCFLCHRNFTIPTLCCHSFATPVKHKPGSFVHHF